MVRHWFWWLMAMACVVWYSTITVYVDTGSGFVNVATADDSTYNRGGMCGMQTYAEAGTTFGSYSFSAWSCGNL